MIEGPGGNSWPLFFLPYAIARFRSAAGLNDMVAELTHTPTDVALVVAGLKAVVR